MRDWTNEVVGDGRHRRNEEDIQVFCGPDEEPMRVPGFKPSREDREFTRRLSARPKPERLNGSLTIGILDHFGTCECLPGTSTRLRFQIAQPPPSASAVGGRTDIKCSLLRSSFGPQSGHRCRLVEIFPKGVCPLSKPGIEPIDCHLGASSPPYY